MERGWCNAGELVVVLDGSMADDYCCGWAGDGMDRTVGHVYAVCDKKENNAVQLMICSAEPFAPETYFWYDTKYLAPYEEEDEELSSSFLIDELYGGNC